ncbi:helix-turn-helix domain-containing protein [Oceanobacillus jeddahense]|uniref:helix-turn-helix domain-containing protein n=1 Tax=Oceanobacillus jeddahense TaxID=1462527 RepID=UPI000595D9AC|nr:helix-turn-helix transcriptional regulator [Oceanobacillus jeddahense]
MSLVDKIKSLCKEKKITIAELERKTGISNGQIRKWDNTTPGINKLQAVADYFDVSVDYLLGRTDVKRYTEPETIAAHHDGEDWTEEELEELERFKEFVRSKRKGG